MQTNGREIEIRNQWQKKLDLFIVDLKYGIN